MPRGGPRQGTPGKLYANRSDMNASRAPQQGTTTAASAGVTPPPPPPAAGPGAPAETPGVHPDSVLPLDAPTQRPGEPLTAGMSLGPGAGPQNTSRSDLLAMRQYLPYLNYLAQQEQTPMSVKAFTQYLQSMVP